MEILDKEDEGHTPEESAEESSEYEEYTGEIQFNRYNLLHSSTGMKTLLDTSKQADVVSPNKARTNPFNLRVCLFSWLFYIFIETV